MKYGVVPRIRMTDQGLAEAALVVTQPWWLLDVCHYLLGLTLEAALESQLLLMGLEDSSQLIGELHRMALETLFLIVLVHLLDYGLQ